MCIHCTWNYCRCIYNHVLLCRKSREVNLTFDENDIILSEVLVLENRLVGKLGKTTSNVHIPFWFLEGGAVQVRGKGLSDAGCSVLLVHESESNRLLEWPAQQIVIL